MSDRSSTELDRLPGLDRRVAHWRYILYVTGLPPFSRRRKDAGPTPWCIARTNFDWIFVPMQTVLIVVHLMIVVALTAVVLLQRSEGGALGMGGGSGGFMTGRGQANVLTRATAILAALFFATSLGLTILANYNKGSKSILDSVAPSSVNQPAPTVPPKGQGSVFDQLRKIEERAGGATPTASAPATPNASATPKAAPVEPTGIPSAPAANAPSAPAPDKK